MEEKKKDGGLPNFAGKAIGVVRDWKSLPWWKCSKQALRFILGGKKPHLNFLIFKRHTNQVP